MSVTLSNLETNTTYPKGIYQVAWEESGEESSKVDVPQFKTNPILVSGISFAPETKSVMINTDNNVEPGIASSTATNRVLKYTSEHPEFITVGRNTGAIRGVAEGTSVITAMSTDGSGKSGQISMTVTNG